MRNTILIDLVTCHVQFVFHRATEKPPVLNEKMQPQKWQRCLEGVLRTRYEQIQTFPNFGS